VPIKHAHQSSLVQLRRPFRAPIPATSLDLAKPYPQAEEFLVSIGQAGLLANVQKLTVELVEGVASLSELHNSAHNLLRQNAEVYHWLPRGYVFEDSGLEKLIEWSLQLRQEKTMGSLLCKEICVEYRKSTVSVESNARERAEVKLAALELERQALSERLETLEERRGQVAMPHELTWVI